MPQCPNKQHPDWKFLADTYGEDAAYLAYVRNNDDIPTATGAKYLLGINEDGQIASMMTKQLMHELTGFNDPAMANAAVEHLLNRYPNVRFFSSEEEFKNFVHTNFLRDIKVSAHDIGLAFKNAVFIRPGEHQQDRMLHELGHIYFDSLADDNRSKVELRKLFAGDGNRPIGEVDEDIVRAIGQMAHEQAKQLYSPTFYGKLVNALRKFWVQVKLTIGRYSERDLIFDMADQLYNNRANIGSEMFGSDVLRHLLVPSNGNVVGKDFDSCGRHNAILSKKLASPTSLSRAFFGNVDMDMVEDLQEQTLSRNIHNSFIGKSGGRTPQAEVLAKSFMRHIYYGMQDKLGTAIHAVMAKQFIDLDTATAERIAEVDDAYSKAVSLLDQKKINDIAAVAAQVRELLTKRYGDRIKFHPEMTLASFGKGLFGRLDLVVELPNGNFVIVDFKTVSKSLFGKNGKTFDTDYIKVHGIGRMPKLSEVSDVVSNAQLFKLYRSLSGLPNSKFRQHQLQGMVYKALVEDQQTDRGTKPIVEEVLFIPIIKQLTPVAVPNSDGTGIDRDLSRWELGSLELDSNVVVTYNRKLNGPSVPDGSNANREMELQKKIETLIEQVKVVALSNHSEQLEESIRRASMRAGAVDVKMAYDAIGYITMASGKPLNELRSRDIQELLRTGIVGIYDKAQQFIVKQAGDAKVQLPENFMNQLNHEQIYWASKGEFIPDFTDIEGGSLRRTKNHSNPAMRFIKVETGKQSVWRDNSAKKGFDHQLHAGKKVRLSLNGGSQVVVFKEYGLMEAGDKGALKDGMIVMLPPVVTSDSGNGMDHTVIFGKIKKVYGGAISVEVENDGGGITSYYVKDKDLSDKPDSVNVHATSDYGIYVVEAAKGITLNHNADKVDTIKAADRTMSDWTPSYSEEQEPIMAHHFVRRNHLDEGNDKVLPQYAGSYGGMWTIFETSPSNRDMIQLYDDTVDEFTPTLKENLSNLQYTMGLIANRGAGLEENPCEELLNSLREAYFCHIIAKEVREEASTISNQLPKYAMTLHNIAQNVAEGREKFSAEKFNGKGSDIWGALFKLPRLIKAQQFGANIYKSLLDDAYNEAQTMIKTNCEHYNVLVEQAKKAGYDLKELMYQRPSNLYSRTRPYVFKSVNDEELKGKPELLELLKFLESFYRKTVPRFTTIGGTMVPLTDMDVSEASGLGRRSFFWRDRFVHLFSSKPWDSEKVSFDPETGSSTGKNAQLRPLREWKRMFLEQNTIPELIDKNIIGGFFQHIAFRWTSYETKSFGVFASSNMHMLDRKAREQYNERNGYRRENNDRSHILRNTISQRGGNSQSLIPTMEVEMALRSSIRDSVNGYLMSGVSPVASYIYDASMKEKNQVAADFVFRDFREFYPGMKQRDDSPYARIIRASMYLASMTYLGINIAAQKVNFTAGQLMNAVTGGSFRTGWALMGKALIDRDPMKVIRLLRYYKVIDITEDFIFDPKSNTLSSRAGRWSMSPMQFVENLNHAPLIIGMLGRRIFENLDSSMTNELDRNGNDTGVPKRGLQYRISIPDGLRDKVKGILIANGCHRTEVERTIEQGFVWCAPIDLRAISSTMGMSVAELKDGALTRDNDYDLPSKADISYILKTVVGQAQGDYRKTLRNAFSHSTLGAPTVIFRKFWPSIYSQTIMASKRDSNYELMVTWRDKIPADCFHYILYGISPYYIEYKNGKTVEKRIGTKQERRIKFLHQAVEEMLKYNLRDANGLAMINMEDTGKTTKGRQLGTVMILTKLMRDIIRANDEELSLEKLMTGELDEAGRQKLDEAIMKLAKSKGRANTFMSTRARNFFLLTTIATLIFFICRPHDDEMDAQGNVMVSQMKENSWYRYKLYMASQLVLFQGVAPFVMPEKIENTYTPTALYGYYKRLFKGSYDKPYQYTFMEGIADTPEGQKRADAADRIFRSLPIVNGIYANVNDVYDMLSDRNEVALKQHEDALMASKYIQLATQRAYQRLKEEDPERFQQIMEAQGFAKAKREQAMAVIWNRIKGGGDIDMDTFDYDMSTENMEAITDSYENELKNTNNQ